MLRVIAVTALEPPGLRVEFNDGVICEIDCAFLMRRTLGEPLKDPLHPAPELLHGNAEPARALPHRSAA